VIETVAVVSALALAVTLTDPNATLVTEKLHVAAWAGENKLEAQQKPARTARVAAQRKNTVIGKPPARSRPDR
jgi:hypothetical protein